MSNVLKKFFPVLMVLFIAGVITWGKVRHQDRVWLWVSAKLAINGVRITIHKGLVGHLPRPWP